VGKVVAEIWNSHLQIDPLVVNDGSMDLTSEKARASGAIVLGLPFNLGIGGAMQAELDPFNDWGKKLQSRLNFWIDF
jgi:hypothetical protein